MNPSPVNVMVCVPSDRFDFENEVPVPIAPSMLLVHVSDAPGQCAVLWIAAVPGKRDGRALRERSVIGRRRDRSGRRLIRRRRTDRDLLRRRVGEPAAVRNLEGDRIHARDGPGSSSPWESTFVSARPSPQLQFHDTMPPSSLDVLPSSAHWVGNACPTQVHVNRATGGWFCPPPPPMKPV